MRKLHLLERFRVTAEEGSLHEAAKRLGITQPALTKSIQALEAEYDLCLFDRHARGVTLSAFGQRLYAHVKVIDREVQMADAALTHLQTGKTGMLSLGGGATWTTVLLPPILARLQQKFPEVHVNLVTGPNRTLTQQLIDGDIDLMVGGLHKESEHLPGFLSKRPLLRVRSKVITRLGHPLSMEKSVPNARLCDFPWIVYKGDLGRLEFGREQIQRLTGGLPKTLLYTESMVALINLLKSGDYIANVPRPFLETIGDFGVTKIAIEEESPINQTGVIYRHSLISSEPFAFILDALMALSRDEKLQRTLI